MSVEVDDVWLYEMILDYLKKTEETYPILVRESPHFSNGDRKIIVEWISRLTKIFKVGVEAHHLAIFLFDFFIADHQADSQGLYLIGAASFSVACKVNDVETNVPQASKILKLAPFENVMQSYLLKSTELLILQHFNWNVHKPTEASFLEYYAESCLAIEIEGLEDLEYSNKIARYFNKWVTYFREKVLLNDEFRDFLPSKVACSIVISSRISMSLSPEWPDIMVHLSGWYMSDLDKIVHNLRNGLKYDLMMDKSKGCHFLDPIMLYQQQNELNINIPSCSNQGDMPLGDSSFSQTKDTHSSFNSSVELLSTSLMIPPNNSIYGSAVNHLAPSRLVIDDRDVSHQNSNAFLHTQYASMNITNEHSISLTNTILGDHRLILATPNELISNQPYLSTHSFHKDSFNILSEPFPVNVRAEPSMIGYYQQPMNDTNLHHEVPLSYITQVVDPLYLIVSQTDNNHSKQYQSKHSHSMVVTPNNIPPRRSQNRDSIISNSVNNGYYALKKRAPGLVINVNGAGSSYSINCTNTVKPSSRQL